MKFKKLVKASRLTILGSKVLGNFRHKRLYTVNVHANIVGKGGKIYKFNQPLIFGSSKKLTKANILAEAFIAIEEQSPGLHNAYVTL